MIQLIATGCDDGMDRHKIKLVDAISGHHLSLVATEVRVLAIVLYLEMGIWPGEAVYYPATWDGSDEPS